MHNKFQRVEPDDPNRCQAVGGDGQCPFRALGSRRDAASQWEGSKFCARHTGYGNRARTDESKRLYLAAVWAAKIGNQADHPKVKSLREEMGILRMMLNEKLESIHDQQQLLMNAGAIVEMTREIGKLAGTAHKIEKDMGQLLDKTQAEAWVTDIVEIISRFISDPDTLMAISELIIESLQARTQVGDHVTY